jgi:hypothetical protein
LRDPGRIDPAIEELREFWRRHPDWRLGQVVVNATRRSQESHQADPFLIEDAPLLRGLRLLEESER